MKLAYSVVVFCVATAGCAQTPDTKAAVPVVMNGQGEMAGEVTTNSVILQTRLTSVDRLVDGDVPGAPAAPKKKKKAGG